MGGAPRKDIMFITIRTPRQMLSHAVNFDRKMLSRSDRSPLSAGRFPLNLIRTYNQMFSPRELSSYYQLALLADAPPIRSERGEELQEAQGYSALGLRSSRGEQDEWTKSE